MRHRSRMEEVVAEAKGKADDGGRRCRDRWETEDGGKVTQSDNTFHKFFP